MRNSLADDVVFILMEFRNAGNPENSFIINEKNENISDPFQRAIL